MIIGPTRPLNSRVDRVLIEAIAEQVMTISELTMYEDKSFWAREFGRYTPNPPLRESIDADVAIVGGGFLGLNTAREFKKDNPAARVVVLEQAVVGYGASGRNAGFNMTLFGLEPQVTRLRWGSERTAAACRYMIRAVEYTRRLIEENQLASDYSHPGFLRLAYNKAQIGALKSAYKVYQDLGVADELGLRWIEQAELQDEFNSPIFAAGLSETHSGLLHPCRHVRELKRIAIEAGVQIYEQTPVDFVVPQATAITLTAPGGTVRAEKVVLATNAYTHLLRGLGKIHSRQFPMWTSVIVTERLSDAQWASVGWANRQGLEDVRQLIHYFRPTADGRILIGGQDVHAPWGSHSNMDHDFNPPVWRGLEAQLKRIFPSLRDVKVAYRWSGPVSVNIDMTPEIGFVGDERIICSTGCLGHGVSLTHLNGRLVADLLGGKKTDLTDFWIVNRKAVRLPGRLIPYISAQTVRAALRTIDHIAERNMPA
jgi:glycine/D-amino acid oxidase-like deaminating enzyme